MTLNKSVKFYLIFLLLFLLLTFYFSRNENFSLLLNSINKIKDENFFIAIFFLFLISILIIIAGFVMPILFINGFILGGNYGSIVSLLSITIGSYIFFLIHKNNMPKKLLKIYKNNFNVLNKLINKNLLLSLIFIRFFGFGLPFVVHNLIPIFFKANKIYFLISTFFGSIPLMAQSYFIDGIANFLINENKSLKIFLFQKDLIIPIIFILFVTIISFLIKIKYFKKN